MEMCGLARILSSRCVLSSLRHNLPLWCITSCISFGSFTNHCILHYMIYRARLSLKPRKMRSLRFPKGPPLRTRCILYYLFLNCLSLLTCTYVFSYCFQPNSGSLIFLNFVACDRKWQAAQPSQTCKVLEFSQELKPSGSVEECI